MKRSAFYLMVIVMSLTAIPTTAFTGENTPTAKTLPPKEIPAEVRTMLDRIEEIKAMDKSSLSREERKELRKELRAMKTAVKSTGSGIYISVGALIVILLLIIIL